MCEGHHHKTAIETFTGLKGKCIFEIVTVGGKRDTFLMEPGLFFYVYDNSIMTPQLISLFHSVQTGTHLIMGPMTTHEMRNDEEDDCVMLTTLIAVDEGSQLSKSGMSCSIFYPYRYILHFYIC